jgi:periplasmic divalent cation tolerance protein
MTDSIDLLVFHTTVGSRDDAEKLAHSLVQCRLAACVQVEAIESVYFWEGQVLQEPEWRLTCKTVASRQKEISALIKTMHPYELPEMYFIPISGASEAYSRWVIEMTEQ